MSSWRFFRSTDRLDSEDAIEGEASKYAYIQIQGCNPLLVSRDTAPVLFNLLTSAYPGSRRSSDVRLFGYVGLYCFRCPSAFSVSKMINRRVLGMRAGDDVLFMESPVSGSLQTLISYPLSGQCILTPRGNGGNLQNREACRKVKMELTEYSRL